MTFNEELQEHFLHGHKKYLRHISVDCIISGFHDNELKVLLLHATYAGLWAFPGGFILKDEHMDEAAKRILKQRTGLDNIFMKQFHVFSAPERSPKKMNQLFLKKLDLVVEDSWMFDRFLTVGYTALVDFSKAQPVPDSFFRPVNDSILMRFPNYYLTTVKYYKRPWEICS